MKRVRPLMGIGAALLGASILGSCGPQLDTQKMSESQIRAHANEPLTDRLMGELNSYRRSQGLPDLKRDGNLDRMAQQHCEFMLKNRGKFSGGSGNVSHFGFEERTLFAQRQLGMGEVAENVASVTQVGDKADPWISQTWIKSTGHRYNLMQKWDYTGIAVSMDQDGTVFATQLFAMRDHSQLTLQNRLRQY